LLGGEEVKVTIDNERAAVAGRNFLHALARAGKQQTDIMTLTGASQSTVSNWAARGVSRNHAPAVAKYLGVPADKICAWIPPESVPEGPPRHYGTSDTDFLPAGEVLTSDSGRRRLYPDRLIALIEEADLNASDLRMLEDVILRLVR